jgi:hypothetical protein
MGKAVATSDDASVVGLQALTFIATDSDRLQRFMSLTGLGPDDLRAGAQEPAFLVGVLDHLLADESLLLTFCEETGLPPEAPGRARMALDGE